jgi:hypothetical protein
MKFPSRFLRFHNSHINGVSQTFLYDHMQLAHLLKTSGAASRLLYHHFVKYLNIQLLLSH